MCPPDYYDIEYEINPWMHVTNKVDKQKVSTIYNQLKALYESLGVDVYEIGAVKGLPDMVYTANLGQVVGEKFIVANFKYEERRKEADFASAYFKKKFGYETIKLPDDIFFEGQGDLLSDGKRFFIGWGKRTDKRAKSYLEKYLGADIMDFELVNPYFYHLDTALAPISPEIVVYNPQSFTADGIKKIHKNFKNCIETNDIDSKVIACNMVIVGNNIVHGAGISHSLSENLGNLGYSLHSIDTREYIKGGGSVKCVSFEF